MKITQDEIDIVQYGSDDTKTHRKIKHILGQKQSKSVGRLLVSELSIAGASKLFTESILFCFIFSRSSGDGEKNKAHKTIIAALSDIAAIIFLFESIFNFNRMTA